MKRLIAMMMAIVMVVIVLSGCGEKAVEDGFTEVVMWSGDSHAKVVMDELVKEFNETIGKENKVKFVWELKEGGGTQELEIALQNGKEPDLFTGSTLRKLAENNYIVSLDDIPGLSETVAKNSDVRVERQNVYNGKMYIMATAAQVYGLAYNKDMFKEAGIVDENGEAMPPKTLSEVREVAKKLTDASKQKYGIVFPGKWGSWFNSELVNTSLQISGSTGYNFQEGKFDWSALSPMLNLVLDLKNDGSVYPGMEGIDNDPARARFAEGNIGMKFAVSWDIGVWNDQFPAKCDWGIAPLPVKDEGTSYYQYKAPSFSAYISRRNYEEKGADAVSLVYNWLYSDETLQKLYGECIFLPWRYDIVKDTKLDNPKKGWEDFGEIVGISVATRPAMPSDTSAYENIAVDFLNRVWTGKVGVDEWISERNKISEEGVKLYKELHPDEDFSDRVYPDYNIERK